MIIGVAGNGIGCGKTTTVRNITSTYDFIEMNLADELKRLLMWINPFDVYFSEMVQQVITNLFRERYTEELDQQIKQCFVKSVQNALAHTDETMFRIPEFGELFIRKTPYSRIYMQGIGEGFRQFREDVWIDFLLDKAAGHNVIIGDVRYKSEVRKIKERGGIVLYVERAKPDDQAQGLAKIDPNYIGEKDLADYPFNDFPHEARITNDRDLQHLKASTVSIIQALHEALELELKPAA